MKSSSSNVSEVLVFKTDIDTPQQLEDVRVIISRVKNITRWSIDREDIDRVLRIECEQLLPQAVIKMLCDAGFACEELPD